jgi:hypothetical protein
MACAAAVLHVDERHICAPCFLNQPLHVCYQPVGIVYRILTLEENHLHIYNQQCLLIAHLIVRPLL